MNPVMMIRGFKTSVEYFCTSVSESLLPLPRCLLFCGTLSLLYKLEGRAILLTNDEE